jgi:hypothetical protein
MERSLIPKRGKKASQENDDEEDPRNKKKRTIIQENKRSSLCELNNINNHSDQENCDNELDVKIKKILEKHLSEIKLEKEKNKIKNSLMIKNSKNVLIKMKIVKLKTISNNLLRRIVNFFTIEECFNFIKINKRMRNSILKNNKIFYHYIQLKKSNSVTFPKIFDRHLFDPFSYFQRYLIEENLSLNEIESLFQEILSSITLEKTFKVTQIQSDFNFYLLKLLTSHPKCSIQSLEIFLIDRVPDIYNYLAEIISRNTSIGSLSIKNLRLFYDSADQMINALAINKHIKKLSISISNNTETNRSIEGDAILEKKSEDGFFLLMSVLNKNILIEEFVITHLFFNRKINKIISDFIEENTTLKSITFDSCNVKESKSLFKGSLRYNKTIESIKFRNFNFNYDVLKALAKDLSHEKVLKGRKELPINTTLKHLSFNECNLKQFDLIFEIFRKNSSLNSLELYGYKYKRDFKVKEIAEFIRNNNTIKILDLSKNVINKDFFLIICEALKVNTCIHTFRLKEIFVDTTVEHIKDLFAHNQTIRVFDVTPVYNPNQPGSCKLIDSLMLARVINDFKNLK